MRHDEKFMREMDEAWKGHKLNREAAGLDPDDEPETPKPLSRRELRRMLQRDFAVRQNKEPK